MDYYIGAREVSETIVDIHTGEKSKLAFELPEATFVFRVGEELSIPRETFREIAQQMGTVDAINSTLLAIAIVNDANDQAEALYRFQEPLGTIFTGMCVSEKDVFCLGADEKGQVVYNFFDEKMARTYIYDVEARGLKEFYLTIAEKKERNQDEIASKFFKENLGGEMVPVAMNTLNKARCLAEEYKGTDILILCNYIRESFEQYPDISPERRVDYVLATEFAMEQCARGNIDPADILKKYKGHFNAMALVNDIKIDKESPTIVAAINMRVQKHKAYIAKNPDRKI